jgi:hypothetical protein
MRAALGRRGCMAAITKLCAGAVGPTAAAAATLGLQRSLAHMFCRLRVELVLERLLVNVRGSWWRAADAELPPPLRPPALLLLPEPPAPPAPPPLASRSSARS